MEVTVRQLRAAIAVAKHLSFRRAAETIYVSQPALSTAVAELESSIGVRLFDRTSRSVQLTTEGTTFIERSQRIVDEIDQLLLDTTNAVKQRQGTVVVSAVSSVAGRLLSTAMLLSNKQYPALNVKVRDDVASRVLALVRNGEVDFAVTVKPRIIEDDMIFEPRMQDPFYLVCHRNDPIAQQNPVTWEAIKKARLIALSTTSGVHEIVENELRRNNVPVGNAVMVSHLSTIHGMLEAGFGISILPHLALPSPDHPNFAIRKIHGTQLSRTLGIYRRKDRSLSSAATGFVEAVDKAIINYERTTLQSLAPLS